MHVAVGPSNVNSRARRGHTLAELVVVLTLLTILGAIAVPRFAGADASYRAQGAAHRLADSFRFAAATARSRGTTVRFRASASGDNITAALASPYTLFLVEDLTEPPFRATLDSTRYTTGETEIRISPFGAFSASGIFIVSSGAHSSAVIVDDAEATVRVVTVQEAAEFEELERFD